MEVNAILHNTEECHILVTKEYNYDAKEFGVKTTVHYDGIILSPSMVFKGIEHADETFENFKGVELCENSINEVVSGLLPEPIFK